MPFITFKNDAGRYSLKCPHGMVRASKGTGKHKVQSVNFTGCLAACNVREQKDGTWKVTTCITKHSGHIVSKVVYNTYRNVKKTSKEDEEYVAELAKAKAKNRIIAERFSERTGKNYKTKDINNLIRKIGLESEEGSCLEKDLESYITEGGYVQYRKDEDGYIDVLWIQTGYMKEAVTATKPRTFEVDTTFGTLEKRNELFELTEGLLVKPANTKVPVLFKTYYERNWEPINQMWVYAYRKNLPIDNIYDTNAVEHEL